MSLSVPQNGVKADNEPVIELFVKVRGGEVSIYHQTSLNFEFNSFICAVENGDTRFFYSPYKQGVRWAESYTS